ncbi:hypothetical protein [Rhodococcus sp. 66b]|uniref:hypothetical protein n=1 Tax=Rhodococcus sp. 66b TaxID=1945511 RepID=UPI001F53B37B|nr:hypothetical protein [Rhodococcus sp. 66b]
MRTHFADSLDDLAAGLASMCALTVTAIADATTALLDVDLPPPNEYSTRTPTSTEPPPTWNTRHSHSSPYRPPSPTT